MNTFKQWILILTLIIVLSGIVYGESADRCNESRLVSIGDHYDDVLAKCGDPDGYTNFVNGFGVPVAIELRYDRNKGEYSRYFLFNQRGVCIKIRIGNERNSGF
jgi:hypothetical protein